MKPKWPVSIFESVPGVECSVGKVPVTEAQGPQFRASAPTQKSRGSIGGWRQANPHGFQASKLMSSRFHETPYLKR